MSFPMRTDRLRHSVLPLALLAAGTLGMDGATEPARAQYPSNFEPYNAYYYSLHAPYYYYITPQSMPAPSRAARADAAGGGPRLRVWSWGWLGGGWDPRWEWRGLHR